MNGFFLSPSLRYHPDLQLWKNSRKRGYGKEEEQVFSTLHRGEEGSSSRSYLVWKDPAREMSSYNEECGAALQCEPSLSSSE